MFDTLHRAKSRLLVFVVIVTFLISSLPLPFASNASTKGKAIKKSAKPSAAAPVLFQSQPTYDKLLQDDSNGSTLRFNSTTGQYLFNRCSDGLTVTGTAAVTKHGCTFTLTQNGGGRKVNASLDTCVKRGNATLQMPIGTTVISITDKNTANNPASADSSAPQVTVEAPNGGEILDTASSFTISWHSSDHVAVTSQSLLLSTDGGSTFNTIAAGLAGDVSQYQWTVPASVNNKQVSVRVVAKDAACNASRDDSDANFTLWNPPASFAHVAEAPLYMASGGFNANVYMCNSSSGTVIVELGLRKPSGDATANFPAQIALAPGDARKLKVSDYLTLASSQNMVEGSVRLRHNGSSDGDVQAMIAVDKGGEEQSFTAPFVYLTSEQSEESAMQCSPMFYLDDETSAYVALQNCRNYPVRVGVKLVYGTGEPNTPNGTYLLPEITLGGQRHMQLDLSSLKEEIEGAKWGSIVLTAPPQSVAAHTVMKSAVNRLAFGAAFSDPAMEKGTTKVASGLKLDYDMDMKPCMLVCNMSETETRVVTATFETDIAVAIPPRQITLAPGQQKMIELEPRELLSAGQKAMADVRLTYSGAASDIMAGAVSMSASEGRALASQFVEPAASNSRQLGSPFFRVDPRTEGIVQLSNHGTSGVRAGVVLKFANSSAGPVTSRLVQVGAGKTVTLNIQEYLELAPEGVAAEGCLKVIHNGAPGTVTASFTAIGTGHEIGLDAPMQGGPQFPTGGMMIFPEEGILQPGESTTVSIITGGGSGPFSFGASDGTIVATGSPAQDVYEAVYTAPDDDGEVPEFVTIEVTSPSGTQVVAMQIQKVKLRGIQTLDPQGVSTNGRLNPDGGAQGTTFVLRGKKPFPEVPLEVRFKQGDLDVRVPIPVDSASRPTPDRLRAIAPPNTKFVGDAEMQVFAGSTRISKKTLCDPCDPSEGDCGSDGTLCSAYYSFDPPTPATSLSVQGFNRLGGNLTITAVAGGFRAFNSSVQGIPPVNPDVNVGGIGFDVNNVTASTTPGSPSMINGNVLRAGPDIESCTREGVAPCKRINVRNPGGRSRDRVRSNVDLYNLLPGPPPAPENRFPDSGPSIGGTVIMISGSNMDFTDDVTIGGTRAQIITRNRTSVVMIAFPHLAGGGNQILIFDIDRAATGGTGVPNGNFTYLISPVTPIPNTRLVFVGPGEGVQQPTMGPGLVVSVMPICTSNQALAINAVTPPQDVLPGNRVFEAVGSLNCQLCTFGTMVSGSASFTLANAAAQNDQRFWLRVTREINFTRGSENPCTRSF